MDAEGKECPNAVKGQQHVLHCIAVGRDTPQSGQRKVSLQGGHGAPGCRGQTVIPLRVRQQRPQGRPTLQDGHGSAGCRGQTVIPLRVTESAQAPADSEASIDSEVGCPSGTLGPRQAVARDAACEEFQHRSQFAGPIRPDHPATGALPPTPQGVVAAKDVHCSPAT